VKILRRFKDSSVANEWGTRAHDAFEARIDKGTPLPEGMQHWEPMAAKIENLPGQKLAEYKLALTPSFEPAPWDAAWTRGKADLIVIDNTRAAVIDYKTGKYRPGEQLMLYAGYVFAHWPEVQVVQTGYVWLKEKRVTREQYERDDRHAIWERFMPRVKRLEVAFDKDQWPARPSGLCNGWCPVATCEHNKTKG
jgi:hypothetical protein